LEDVGERELRGARCGIDQDLTRRLTSSATLRSRLWPDDVEAACTISRTGWLEGSSDSSRASMRASLSSSSVSV